MRLVITLALVALSGCGGPDTSSRDAGSADAAVADAAVADAAVADAAVADAAVADAAVADAASPALGVISPAALDAALAAKDFLLIDVHVPYAGTIPGTDTSIPYTQADALATHVGADLDRKVILTCLSGHMSESAGNDLVARGYRQVRHLEGGMSAWAAAGYSLDRRDAGP